VQRARLCLSVELVLKTFARDFARPLAQPLPTDCLPADATPQRLARTFHLEERAFTYAFLMRAMGLDLLPSE
jgi:hypothetical protein